MNNLLISLIRQKGENFATVSRAIGMNQTYIQQRIKYGNPRRFPEHIRIALGKYFDVSPDLFREPGELPVPTDGATTPDPALVSRAMAVIDRILAPGPDRERIAPIVFAAAYALLERQRAGVNVLDDEGSLRIFAQLANQLRGL